MRASTWCKLNLMANKYTLTLFCCLTQVILIKACEHTKAFVFRYNEKWTQPPRRRLWGSFVTHSFLSHGPWGRNEPYTAGLQVTSLRPCWWFSLGSNLYFHLNPSRKQFYCIDPQHGRLVTWLQTKNIHMVTWYQWRRRGCHQSSSGDCSDD